MSDIIVSRDWQLVEFQFDTYWLIYPINEDLQCWVTYVLPSQVGEIRGQIIECDGWYWYVKNLKTQQFSHMVGPFAKSLNAMVNCEKKAERISIS